MGCVPRGSKVNVHWPLGLRAPLVKQSEPHTAILVRPAGQGLGGVQSARTSQGQEGIWEARAAMPRGGPQGREWGVEGTNSYHPKYLP